MKLMFFGEKKKKIYIMRSLKRCGIQLRKYRLVTFWSDKKLLIDHFKKRYKMYK